MQKIKIGVAIYRGEPDEIREITLDYNPSLFRQDLGEDAVGEVILQLTEEGVAARHVVVDYFEEPEEDNG